MSPEGSKRWEAIVPGIAEGTPQITADGNNIYVTHNDIGLDDEYTVGKLSLIRNDRFGLVSPIDLDGAGLFGVMERPAPFSPLSAAIQNGGTGHRLYFGESWGEGGSSFGFLYEFNGTHVSGLRRADFSTITPPVLSTDGKSLWVGGTASSVHAWVNNKPFTSPPTWSTTLGSTERPLRHAPILSADNDMLFVVTHERKVFCLDAKTGGKRWSNDGLIASPDVMRLSGDETILVTIGTDEGVVTQFSAQTGRILFQLSCHEIRDSEFCTMPIEGDVSVSRGGDQINFASIYGDVYLLTLDPPDFVFDPTASPSFAPTNDPTIKFKSIQSLHPSIGLSETPSLSSDAPSMMPTNVPVISTKKPSSSPLPSPSLFPSNVAGVLSPSNEDANTTSPLQNSGAPALAPASSPAFSPNFAPADMPFFSPAATDDPATKDGIPTAKPIVLATKPFSVSLSGAPSLLGTSNSPDSVPTESTTDIKVSEVHLDSLMDAQGNVSTSHTSVFVYAALFLVLLTIVTALGILVGRIWQRRVDRWHELPAVEKDGYLKDETSFDLQTRFMD